MEGGKTMEEKILVAVDGSDNSKRALLEAKKYAESVGGNLTLLIVVEPLGLSYWGYEGLAKQDEERLDNVREVIVKEALELLDGFEGEVETKVKEGHPADEILKEAKEGSYDLIVMGSRGLGAFSRTILGSVSHKVLNHTKINVLTVK